MDFVIKNKVREHATARGFATPGRLARYARLADSTVRELWYERSSMIAFKTLEALVWALELTSVGDLLVLENGNPAGADPGDCEQ